MDTNQEFPDDYLEVKVEGHPNAIRKLFVGQRSSEGAQVISLKDDPFKALDRLAASLSAKSTGGTPGPVAAQGGASDPWKDACIRTQKQLDKVTADRDRLLKHSENQYDELVKLRAEVDKTHDIELQGEGYKLAQACTDAIIAEFADRFSSVEASHETNVREIISKYVTRYFANAQDTNDKLARAMEELHALRSTAHSERMGGMQAIMRLAEAHLWAPGVTRPASVDNFRKAAEGLLALHVPVTVDEENKAV